MDVRILDSVQQIKKNIKNNIHDPNDKKIMLLWVHIPPYHLF